MKTNAIRTCYRENQCNLFCLFPFEFYLSNTVGFYRDDFLKLLYMGYYCCYISLMGMILKYF